MKERKTTMHKDSFGKRVFPRFQKSLLLEVTPGIGGKVHDLSEYGINFSLENKKSLPNVISKIKIYISDKSFIEPVIKVIWKKETENSKNILFGACIEKITDDDLEKLRYFLISEKTNEIVEHIQHTEYIEHNEKEKIKTIILNLWLNDFRSYLKKINNLSEKANKKLIKNEGEIVKKLTALNNSFLNKIDNITKELDNKKLNKIMHETFRFFIGPRSFRSDILRRGYEKPFGYPGDFQLLEDIYDNMPKENCFGKYFGFYFLDNPYAQSVRKRKNELRKILVKEINNTQKEQLKVMNLACGSCREIKEMYEEKKITNKCSIYFNLIDHEQKALDYSKEKLSVFEDSKTKFNFINNNILRLYRIKDNILKELGQQDIIYSIGLFDYLPDKLLKRIMNFCLYVMKDSGKLFISFKDEKKDPFAPLPPRWFCDWEFIPRTKEDAEKLLTNLEFPVSYKYWYDKTDRIIFFSITKR